MDFGDILADFPPESDTLEYKRKRADKPTVVKELVALANTEGGKLIYGVKEENGSITGFDDFHDFADYEEDLNNLLAAHVRPRIDCEIVELQHECHTLMGITVAESTVLHTFRDGKPYVPTRMGSTTDYLEGDAIVQYYRATCRTTTPTSPQPAPAGCRTCVRKHRRFASSTAMSSSRRRTAARNSSSAPRTSSRPSRHYSNADHPR